MKHKNVVVIEACLKKKDKEIKGKQKTFLLIYNKHNLEEIALQKSAAYAYHHNYTIFLPKKLTKNQNI